VSDRLPLSDAAPPSPEPPDLGRRLSAFIVSAALGTSHDALSREFGVTLIEIDRLLRKHGQPPRILRRPPAPPPSLFVYRKSRR
jgi:hypothetical protein